MSFRGLIAHFFFVVNTLTMSGYTMVYLPIYIHLGCFQVLTVMNKAATKIHMQVFVWTWFSTPFILALSKLNGISLLCLLL